MKKVFAPGCALMIYKPHLAEKMLSFLNIEVGSIEEHLICCRHESKLEEGTEIINTCSGCHRRYREEHDSLVASSLWEYLAESDTFPFPDYQGKEMAILDTCPTRSQEGVHEAIRVLLKKMNITIIEPEKTRTKGTCCGDSFYGILPIEEVKEKMKKRAAEMPVDEVAVYCVSCCKSMHIGGKKPRYIIDLLFGEETVIGTYEPQEWHHQLEEFISQH